MNQMIVGERSTEFATSLVGQFAPVAPASRGRLAWLLPIYFLVAVCIQWVSGAYQSEASHYADEASHVVTSLMIRDYVVDALGENPLRFAENYYVHYPKVGFGIWPPVFHTTAAAWTIPFGASRASFLAVMAVEAAFLAWLTFLLVRRWVPLWPAALCGALVLLPRLVTELYTAVMVDVLLSVLSLVAVMLLIRFLETGQRRWAAAYGAMTALAMLTKGNAASLVLVPVFLVIAGRRWDLLARSGLYIAAGIVLLLGLPWQLLTMRFLTDSVPMSPPSWERAASLAGFYLSTLRQGTGSVLVIAGIAGVGWALWTYARAPREAGTQGLGALAAMVLSVYGFHLVAPTPAENRYLLPLVAPLFCLAAWAVAGAARGVVTVRWAPMAAVLLLAASATYGLSGPDALGKRDPIGFRQALASLDASGGAKQGEVMLVASEVLGEGALITEVALGDNRPERYVLRATKVISQSNWFRQNMKMLHASPAELSQYLDSVPVDVIFLDRSDGTYPEERDLLQAAISAAPQRWARVAHTAAGADGRSIDVYRRQWQAGETRPQTRNLRVGLPHTLGRELMSR